MGLGDHHYSWTGWVATILSRLPSTINQRLLRTSRPMPGMEAHIVTVAGAKFITVCDIQSTYHQIPVAEAEQNKTDFVTQNRKWVFQRLHLGIANAPFQFSRMISLEFSHFGQKSGLVAYMEDCICCSSTWESHLKLVENTFKAIQAAGLTLKPSNIQFGPKEVKYLGFVLSADGIRIGDDAPRL